MKHITILFITMIMAIGITAQERHAEIRGKIEARKVAFLSTQLELTPETSKAFWPLYNAYSEELHEIHESNRPIFDENEEAADPDAMLDAMLKNESQILDLKKKYVSQLRDVIGAEKTLMFFKLDREFKERMLREIGERRDMMHRRKRDGK